LGGEECAIKFYTTTKLSAHQDLTPEGFLLARDIRIARCGVQHYRDVELPDVIANGDGWISVDRDPTEVFNEDSIASFTGKPITNDHPTTVVTPDNWHSLAIGTVQNVRKGAGADHDCLVADLLFTAQRGIDLIRSGKRALSVGYDAVYEQTQPGRAKQRQIVANHVALVDEGRCGPRCTIVDHAPWYNVDYADPPSLPRRGPPVRQYLGAAPPPTTLGVRRQVGDFADIDYPWTRDLEAWVNEPRDPEGQWTAGGGSHAPQENAREPVIGKSITVMRVGSEKGGLGGRDAGNLASVANHYVRLSDFETPQSGGGSPTHMSVYQITLPPQLGEYQRFNAHGGGTGDLVGRSAGKHGDGFHIVYSFPKTYKDEKRTLSIPLTEVDAELKKMGYNNADEAGGNETAKAMQAVIDRHTVKVATAGDAWQESEHPRGQPENRGEFATAPGGGGHGIPGLPPGKLSRALREFKKRDAFEMTAAKGSYGRGRYEVVVKAKPVPGIKTIGEGTRMYQYDPAYAHEEVLYPEDPIISRTIATPNEGLTTELPVQKDPTKMYRGMSSEEYEDYLKTGEFKSKSEYNMSNQQGLTYWSTDPDQAESYANGFAPVQFRPTFEKPAYVVVAKKADESDTVHAKGTGENELGIKRAVKADEVAEVWRGRVVVFNAGEYGVSDLGDDTFEDGSAMPVGAEVVWEKVEPGDADAGGGVSFVSPSVADHLDFAQAVAGLKSKRQQILQAASQDIDRSLGLRSTDMGAVGAWSDGAENSIMTTVHGGSFEELMVAAAMKASIAEQKAALVFKDDPAGTSWLFSFPAKGDLNEIHKNLLADGVAFHTIIPTSGGATVYVVDMEGDTKHAVAQAAQRYGATVDTERGHSEFIGTQKQDGTDAEQRADAVAEYGRRIAGSGVPGAQALWERIHNAYGQKLHLEHDSWHADIDYGWSEDVEWRDEFDPNEPRVTSGPTAGEWTSTGGGAPSSTKSVLPNVKSKTAREVKAEAAKAAKAAQAMATRAQNVARIKAMPAKEPDAISTRLISEPQRRETGNDPHTHAQDLVDWATATRPDAAEWLKKATDLLVGNKLYPPGKDKTGKAKVPDEYVGMPPGPEGETPAQAAERFIDFAKDNILAIYHAVPTSWRHDASKWYDGANVIAHDWAKEYKYSAPQIAGVMASLSPKKDWFMNVDLAKRILDYTRDYKDVQFTDNSAKQLQAMIDKKKTKKQQADKILLQKILHNLKRPDGAWKTLGEVTDPVERAAWMNMYDLAETKDPNFKALTPGGKFLDYVTNKGEEAEEDDDEDGEEAAPAALGARTTRTWQVLKNTAKAIRILQDGSTENISRNLGEAHKVRNFYMNILHPNSPNGHVTIDTHAIAAAFLRPFGQKDEEVLVGLGNASPSNSVLGLGGTYPIIAEAYRRAAAQASEEEPGLTILPRQMQSITWEGGRGLFSPEFKRDKVKRAAVTDIWRQVSQKKITAAAARKKIMLLASPELKGVPRSPDWVGK
jgi:hypothetical protein